jgi:glycosyltransferase involved in cell wall biosynthesis
MNAGPWLPVPPNGYGGIETVVATLVPQLRAAGVRVVLATVPGSTVEADEYLCPLPAPKFESIAAPYNQSCGIAHAHMAAVAAALRDRADIDLVHDHLEVVGVAVLAAMGPAAPPALQTLHWDLRKHQEFYNEFNGAGRVRFAAVSRSQLDRAPANLQRQTLGVVPLAVPPPPEDVRTEPGDHALVLARITRDKGQDIAIRACQAAGVPLILAGPVAGINDPEDLSRRLKDGDARLAAHPDVRFFLDCVEPLLDGDRVRWVGAVGGEEKERLLQSAKVLLVPNRWAEPGATGVVEALWRGVPVVGTRLGVLPSLIAHGVTGYLADNDEDLAAQLARVHLIDRDACRAAAAPWTPKEMARAYLELYDRLLQGVP